MAMAVLHQFPTFRSVSSQYLPFSSDGPSPNSIMIDRHKCRCFAIVACSMKKPTKTRRKARSDADLCNDIREFLSNAGLPENYVPTMKELSNHGRQDLANIVRRRGYKFIRHLLTASSTENIVEPDIDTGQNEKQEVAFDVSSNGSIQVEDLHCCSETDEELKKNDGLTIATESNALSLQEKVAKFIQHGELDPIEGGGLEIINKEHGVTISSENFQEQKFAFSQHHQMELMISSSGEMSNGSVPSSVQPIENPGLETENFRESNISSEEQTSIDSFKDLIDEKAENRDEVRGLKSLLHQKELELTQLKEQIEKEKLALSLLQSKAEIEISKAQKLVSQKEIELHDAEDTLSGLKEVEIDYSGDGEIVELGGSFNGWDHTIKMDLEPSSSVAHPTGPGSSRLWRAVLWLYPGIYESQLTYLMEIELNTYKTYNLYIISSTIEIKFIVDGHWRIDPQRESINWNGLHNNILRVDR